MESEMHEIKVGDTFNIILWSDRPLWKVTEVKSQKEFVAERVQTEMLNGWQDGTEYPKKDTDGNILTDGYPSEFKMKRKHWYCDGGRVHIGWGATTGYRDPSF